MKEEYPIVCEVCQKYFKTEEDHRTYHDGIEANRPALKRIGEKIQKIINPYW